MLQQIKKFFTTNNNKKNEKYIKIYGKSIIVFATLFFIIGILGNIYILNLNINDIIFITNEQLVLGILLISITPFLGTTLYTFYKIKQDKELKEDFNIKKNLKKINTKIIIIGLLGILFVSIIFEKFLEKEQEENIITQILGLNSGYIVLFFSVFVVLMAIMEELIFRGILFDYIKNKINKYGKNIKIAVFLTIAITASIFGLLHMQYDIITIVQIIFIGFILGYVRYKYGLINTIFIHIINNFIIVLVASILPFLQNNMMANSENKLYQEFKNEKNIILEKITGNYLNPYIYKYKNLLEKSSINNLKKLDTSEQKELELKLKQIKHKYNKFLTLSKLTEKEKKEIKTFIDYIDVSIKYTDSFINGKIKQ